MSPELFGGVYHAERWHFGRMYAGIPVRHAWCMGRASVTAETTGTNSLTSSAEPLTSTWKSGSESSVPSAEKEALVAAAISCSGGRPGKNVKKNNGSCGGGGDEKRAFAARACRVSLIVVETTRNTCGMYTT